MRPTFKRTTLAAAVLAGSQIMVNAAVAQDEILVLEEVIVTAQKREESLQDVPFTVNAVQGDALNQMQITNFQDLELVTSGLEMRNIDGRAGSIALRGVDFNPNSAAAQAVDVYWNGVTLGANASGGIFQEMFDLGRVEILRGPQGTLQGRTSPAGALAIHTAKPVMDEFEGYARTTFTDNSGNNTQVASSIPLIDGKLAARVAAVYNNSDMQEVDNILGGDTSNSETQAGRLSMLWYPTDTLSADFVYQYMENEVDTHHILIGSSYLGQDLPSLRADDFTGINPQVDEYAGRFEYIALTLNWEFAGHDLTYVGGYSEVDSERDFDNASGNSEVGFEPVDITGDYPQVGVRGSQHNSPQLMDDQNYASSHELRLSSLENEFWNYTVGLYYGSESGYFDRYLTRQFPQPAGTAVFFGNVAASPFDLEDLGIFAHNRFDFNHNWSLQIGLRWQENERNVITEVYSTEDAETPWTSLPAGTLLATLVPEEFQKQEFEKLTGNGTLQYAFDEQDIVTYLTTGTSFRPGGVTVTLRDLQEWGQFDEEESWFVEAGMKSTLMDGRLRLNAAAFYQDYDGYIGRANRIALNNGGVPRPDGSPTHESGITTNGDAEVMGAELDFEYLISPDWILGGAMGYVEAEYKDGVELPCNDGDIPAGEVVNTCDVGGNELGPQPRFSTSLRSEYTFSFDSFESYLSGLYAFRGRRTDPDANSGSLGGYATFDLHLGLRDPAATWDVSVFARNLFDREATENVQPYFRDFNGDETGYKKVDVVSPRLIGVSATYRF